MSCYKCGLAEPEPGKGGLCGQCYEGFYGMQAPRGPSRASRLPHDGVSFSGKSRPIDKDQLRAARKAMREKNAKKNKARRKLSKQSNMSKVEARAVIARFYPQVDRKGPAYGRLHTFLRWPLGEDISEGRLELNAASHALATGDVPAAKKFLDALDETDPPRKARKRIKFARKVLSSVEGSTRPVRSPTNHDSTVEPSTPTVALKPIPHEVVYNLGLVALDGRTGYGTQSFKPVVQAVRAYRRGDLEGCQKYLAQLPTSRAAAGEPLWTVTGFLRAKAR